MVDEKATIAEPLTDKEWDDIEAWGNRTLQSYHLSRPKARRIMAEIRELREWKAAVEDVHKTVMSEACASDEKHCTCVPVLRAENARLREAAEYAKSFLVENHRRPMANDKPLFDTIKVLDDALESAAEPAEVS